MQRIAATVGADVADRRARDHGGPLQHSHRRWLALALAAGVVAALGVAAMRNDLRRVQYGLAQALDETRALERERNAALARVRAQRDPTRLARVARERGFVRPERIVDLPAPPPRPVVEESR
ncbi:MAG: hypothetical protein QNK03_28325 [Myxococcota bacterium]|nr:hypothetical protein [Myxococcota bacterium]